MTSISGKRFLSPAARIRLNTSRSPVNDCLEWQGKKDKDGYALFGVKGRRMKVSRWVFYAKHGYYPPMVCHRCDNPCCVEEEHLFEGDAKINAQDMAAKGRVGAKYGPDVPSAQLTAQDVLEVRAHPKVYGSAVKLAKRYGVHRSVIDNIRSGRTYTSVY